MRQYGNGLLTGNRYFESSGTCAKLFSLIFRIFVGAVEEYPVRQGRMACREYPAHLVPAETKVGLGLRERKASRDLWDLPGRRGRTGPRETEEARARKATQLLLGRFPPPTGNSASGIQLITRTAANSRYGNKFVEGEVYLGSSSRVV